MTAWIKVAGDLDTNPKIRKAGRDGRDVFLFALRRQVTRYGVTGRDGRIPLADLEPEYMAPIIMCTIEQASDGLAAALRTGLISIESENPESYVIDGFDEEWDTADPTRNARQKRYRERHRNGSNALRDVSDPLRNAGNASRGEERRGEETREESEVPDSPVTVRHVGAAKDPESAREVAANGHTAQTLTESGNVRPGANGAATRHAGKPIPDPPEEALAIAWSLIEYVLRNNPESKLARSAENARTVVGMKWGDEIRKLHALDGIPYGAIAAMVHWCQREHFWKTIVLSADGLRKNWDRMAAQRTRGSQSVPVLAKGDEKKRRAEQERQRIEDHERAQAALRDRAEVRAELARQGFSKPDEIPATEIEDLEAEPVQDSEIA